MWFTRKKKTKMIGFQFDSSSVRKFDFTYDMALTEKNKSLVFQHTARSEKKTSI